jgi:hypothetical protein
LNLGYDSNVAFGGISEIADLAKDLLGNLIDEREGIVSV